MFCVIDPDGTERKVCRKCLSARRPVVRDYCDECRRQVREELDRRAGPVLTVRELKRNGWRLP